MGVVVCGDDVCVVVVGAGAAVAVDVVGVVV